MRKRTSDSRVMSDHLKKMTNDLGEKNGGQRAGPGAPAGQIFMARWQCWPLISAPATSVLRAYLAGPGFF